MMRRHGYQAFWRIGLLALLALLTTACGGGGGSDKPVSSAPVLTASFTQQVSGLDVSLDASGSTGDIASYQWDFGDGATGTGKTASHSYAAAGTYSVTLTVTDDKGSIKSLSADVVVVAMSETPSVGLVVDSQIIGMRYISTNKLKTLTIRGFTSKKGEYEYFPEGETDFYVGNIKIASVISPEALTALSSIPETTVESNNIARFLQTIDNDQNPDNGIQIPPSVDENAKRDDSSITGLKFDESFDDNFQAVKIKLFKGAAKIPETITVEKALEHSSKSEALSSLKEFDLYNAIANKKNYRGIGGYYNSDLLEKDQRKRAYLWIWEGLLSKEMEIENEVIFSNPSLDVNNVEENRNLIKKYLDYSDSLISVASLGKGVQEQIKMAGTRSFSYELTQVTSLTVGGCDAVIKLYNVNASSGKTSEQGETTLSNSDICKSMMSVLNPFGDPADKLAIINPVLTSFLPTLLPQLIHAQQMNWVGLSSGSMRAISKMPIPKPDMLAMTQYILSSLQIANDFYAAGWASDINNELTTRLVAKEWLSIWFRSGFNVDYMNYLINGNQRKLNGMDEQIDAIALKWGSSGALCDTYNFFNPLYKCTGIEHINYDRDKARTIINSYLSKSNAIFKNLSDYMGPVSDESSEIGTITIDWANTGLSSDDLKANQAPIANAGTNITINDGETADLNGSASSDSDGSITSYEWWLNGQLQGSTSRLSLSKLAVGSHVATLKVKDNQGLVASDTVTIVVKAVPPRMDISASTLDFGSAAYDIKGAQFASKSLTISNGGGQPLTNIKPVLASNNGGFTLNDASSFTLAPGAKRQLTLSAAPKTIGEFSASLQITADGGFSKSVALKSVVNANDLVHRVIPSATSLVVGDSLVLRVEMTSGNPEYQVTVEWGDGKVDLYASQSSSLAVSHVYSAAATPTVKVMINDVGGKHGETSVPLTISGSMPSSTRWSAQAHHIQSDEFAANVPISVSAETLDEHPVQRYSTSWAPQKGSNDEYFIKYRLPIPSGLIKLSHKARLTVVVSPSTIAAYDRELAFVTDQGELIAGWLGETEPVVPGYLQFKPFASDLIRNEPTGALNDDPLLHPQQSVALEWQANQLQAQHYAGGSYTPLATMNSLSGSTLNEINLSFKGNGAIWLVKFEYDADNNGQYDDGAIFANTANQQVDWSIYTGVTPPPVTASRLNDTGITSCADASSWSLPCPVADFPGQDAEFGFDAKSEFIVVDSAPVTSDGSGFYLRSVSVPDPYSVLATFSNTLYAEGSNMFEFSLRQKDTNTMIKIDDIKLTASKEVRLFTRQPLLADHEYKLVVVSVTDSEGNYIENGVNGMISFPGVLKETTQVQDADGHAGFSFTKVSSSGEALAASATEWSCVKDNVTGLLWEIHTDDGGLRDKDNTYSWYNSDTSTNGGHAGTQNGGNCSGGISCDTQGYVAAVNAAGLCGYHDWRLPTVVELQGLVDYSIPAPVPTIDLNFFPDTQPSTYWSSSAAAGGTNSAWDVYFYHGGTGWDGKSYRNQLRLVRSEP